MVVNERYSGFVEACSFDIQLIRDRNLGLPDRDSREAGLQRVPVRLRDALQPFLVTDTPLVERV